MAGARPGAGLSGWRRRAGSRRRRPASSCASAPLLCPNALLSLPWRHRRCAPAVRCASSASTCGPATTGGTRRGLGTSTVPCNERPIGFTSRVAACPVARTPVGPLPPSCQPGSMHPRRVRTIQANRQGRNHDGLDLLAFATGSRLGRDRYRAGRRHRPVPALRARTLRTTRRHRLRGSHAPRQCCLRTKAPLAPASNSRVRGLAHSSALSLHRL